MSTKVKMSRARLEELMAENQSDLAACIAVGEYQWARVYSDRRGSLRRIEMRMDAEAEGAKAFCDRHL